MLLRVDRILDHNALAIDREVVESTLGFISTLLALVLDETKALGSAL